MCLGGGGSSAADDAARREQERQAKIAETTAAVNTAFDDPSRALSIDQFRSAVEQQNLDELARQRQEADRQLTFSLARGGQGGGSQDVFQRGQLLQDFNRGLAKISTFANDRAAALRAQDEQARGNLIRDAQTGLDSQTATQQALKSLQVNLEGAQGGTQLQNLGDLFANIARINNAAAIQRGAAGARIPTRQTILAPPPPSQSGGGGTVARIG